MTSKDVHEKLDRMKETLISIRGHMPMSLAFRLKRIDILLTEALGQAALWQLHDEEKALTEQGE